MATDRRTFLAGLAGAGVTMLAQPVKASSGPAFIAARRDSNGFSVAVLDRGGRTLFSEPLDGRGHGAAVSPDGRTAVMFARRPGRFAVVIDLHRRDRGAVFEPPPDRHFYGHGFFSVDGRLLYATENAFEAARGVLGIYDAGAAWRRVGELSTYGIGPHEALMMRDGRTIAIGNGGIVTHPDYPRQKLNLGAMEPSIAYVDSRTGELLQQAKLPAELHQLSLRHLAQTPDGRIWWGGQYEGPKIDDVPLVGTHRTDEGLRLVAAPVEIYRSMKQYVGSVAVSRDGLRIATTSPRGGRMLVWDTQARRLAANHAIDDVCGVAPDASGFLASDGKGRLWSDGRSVIHHDRVSWDNHAAAVPSIE